MNAGPLDQVPVVMSRRMVAVELDADGGREAADDVQEVADRLVAAQEDARGRRSAGRPGVGRDVVDGQRRCGAALPPVTYSLSLSAPAAQP